MKVPFIRQVTIRNYRSIAACQVNLGPLVFLVGPNGSGKSNFLDAIRFVADSLKRSPDFALRDRGGIGEVRRKSSGHPNNFAIRLDFRLPSGHEGHYAVQIAAVRLAGFQVKSEECRLVRPEKQDAHFRIDRGQVRAASMVSPPASSPDRLFLTAASGHPDFRELFDALCGIEVYNLNPSRIAALQNPDPGDILHRDGGNAASVFKRFPSATRELLSTRLNHVVPQISSVEYKTIGPMETLEFKQAVEGRTDHWRFFSSSMSDGTLRAFGTLLAIYQGSVPTPGVPHPLLIGLEEPETALHPAAAQELLAALREGSRRCQIIVTSHSPDLLDNEDIPVDSILAVESDQGKTRIGPVDEASRQVLAQKLFTVGELLRQGQLVPDEGTVNDVKREHQLSLFDAAE